MILAIYVTFLALSLILVLYGYITEDPIMKMVAWALFFITNIPFMATGISYQSGTTAVLNTSTNTTVTSYDYAQFQNHSLSFYLEVLTAIAFFWELINFGWRRDTV